MRVSRLGLTLTLVAVTSFAADLPPSSDTPSAPPPPPSAYEVAPNLPSSAPPSVRLLPERGGAGRYRYQGYIPEGFHLESQPRRGLLIAGSIAFGVGYLSTVLIGGAGLRDGWALLPLAGPIASSVNQWNRASAPGSGSSSIGGAFVDLYALTLYTTLAVIQTAAQVAGATLLIISFARPQEWLEKDAGVQLSLVPGAAGTTVGATLVGRF